MIRWHNRVLASVAILVIYSALVSCATESRQCHRDALTSRSLNELRGFARWTSDHDVRGAVGEVAWPGSGTEDAQQWSALADRWLTEARTSNLQIFAFGAAPWWRGDEPVAFYRGQPGSNDVTIVAPQAVLFEEHLRGGMAGGVNLAEATFGAPINEPGGYANGNPGVLGVDYSYPTLGTLRTLADRGITEVRFGVMWERLQPRLHETLDLNELKHIRRVLRDADTVGMRVILDIHNYGRYADGDAQSRDVFRLGDPQLPGSSLVDLWTRLVETIGAEPALHGYDIMNEPHDLPGGARAWETISFDVATAIRTIDATTPIWVSGYAWSAAGTFAEHHPAPWLPNTVEPVIYQAHQYFDRDMSGTYSGSYSEENAATAAKGDPCGQRVDGHQVRRKADPGRPTR